MNFRPQMFVLSSQVQIPVQEAGDPASYQANHHIRNCCLFCVSCDQRQCDVAGHTDEQANTRERSRGDVRAQRVVCGGSTRGFHHHQHQEASSKHYHVMYLTMSNTNTLTITCLCYPARGLWWVHNHRWIPHSFPFHPDRGWKDLDP